MILFTSWAFDSLSINVDALDVLSRFAQEEKNALALLLGAEFIRSAAYSVAFARRLSSGDTAMLLEFPVRRRGES